MMGNKNRGFTIIELLVTIVIIAILAAIAIMGYQGLQDRSKSTQLLSAFDQYEKALNLYYLHHGKYPSDPTFTAAPVVCLGSGYSANALFDEDVCRVFDHEQDSVSAVIDAALAGEFTSKPQVHSGVLYDGPNPGGGHARIRGIAYTWHDIDGVRAAGYTMFYYVSGDQACGRGDKFTVEINGKSVTQCALRFHGNARVTVEGIV